MMNIEKKKKQIAEKKRKQAELAKRGQGDLKVSKWTIWINNKQGWQNPKSEALKSDSVTNEP